LRLATLADLMILPAMPSVADLRDDLARAGIDRKGLS
jgi:hypothetical protein